MHHQVSVGIVNRRADLANQCHPLGNAEALRLAVFVDVAAIDPFHDQVRCAGRRGATIVDVGDSRMLQERQDSALRAEATGDFLTLGARRDHLDRDIAPEGLVRPVGRRRPHPFLRGRFSPRIS